MNIEELFKPFLSTENHREWMKQINEQDGYCYATNATCLIRIPKDKVEKDYPPHKKVPNFSVLFERLNFHEPITFTLIGLEKTLFKFDKVLKTVECEDCDGAGKRECDMGHLHECGECDGIGELEVDGEYAYPNDSNSNLIKINESYITPYYFSLIYDFLLKLKKDKYALIASYNDKLKAKVFVIQDFEIMLLPILWDNVDDKENVQVVELIK